MLMMPAQMIVTSACEAHVTIMWHVVLHRREVPKKTLMTAPEVKINTDEADVKKCGAHFETCGWDSLEFDPRYAYTNQF